MTILIYHDKRINKKYLQLRESYRNEKGKPTSRVVKNYGRITEDNKEQLWKLAMEDKAKVEENKGVETIELKFGMSNEKLECSKNLGYIILEKIYKSLNIETFFNKKIQKRSDSFSTNDAIKLLTFSRILEPNSKFKTHQLQDYFFKNPFNLKLRNIYDVLDDAFVVKENLQLHLHKQISKLYNRNLSLVFYDVTNYFFETEIEDELRAKGVSKENRETPIVQMGLLMDQQGIPIAYKLFRGNTLDQLTLIETIEEFQKIFNVHSITLVADKGLNSGRNLQYLINHNHKYIVSQMVRTNDEKFREKILDQNGYKWLSSQHNFKLKEFDWQREYTDKETKEKHQLKYRVITYWSQAFADRERFKRDRKNGFEDKLKSFIGSPTKLNSSNSHGVKRYLKETIVEKKTGEVKNDHQKYISVDWDKFHRDIEMDGYYAIITNDYDSTPIEIIQKYKELWKIEEIFKVTKSNLEGRPVYVWNNNHIEGHFLINFLSLLIMKLIQMKMNWKYSASKIQEALNSCQVQKIKSDIYSFNLQTQEWKDIAEKFNFKVNFDFQKYESINKTIRETLKQPFTFL